MLFHAGLLFALVGVASSAAHPHHQARGALPDHWSQPEDSPVYDLFRTTNFKRQANGTSGLPAVGSPSACFHFL